MNGLTNAYVPYSDVNKPVIFSVLDIFGCLFNMPPRVRNVVPVIIPRYPLNIVLGTIIVSVISAEFRVFS